MICCFGAIFKWFGNQASESGRLSSQSILFDSTITTLHAVVVFMQKNDSIHTTTMRFREDRLWDWKRISGSVKGCLFFLRFWCLSFWNCGREVETMAPSLILWSHVATAMFSWRSFRRFWDFVAPQSLPSSLDISSPESLRAKIGRACLSFRGKKWSSRTYISTKHLFRLWQIKQSFHAASAFFHMCSHRPKIQSAMLRWRLRKIRATKT